MLKKVIWGIVTLIVLIVAYNLILQIVQALKSGERLSEATEQLYKFQKKNQELKKKLSQIKSPDFIEQQARDKLGLSKAGETVVIIPEDKLKLIMEASVSAQIPRLPNPLGWWRVFFK